MVTGAREAAGAWTLAMSGLAPQSVVDVDSSDAEAVYGGLQGVDAEENALSSDGVEMKPMGMEISTGEAPEEEILDGDSFRTAVCARVTFFWLGRCRRDQLHPGCLLQFHQLHRRRRHHRPPICGEGGWFWPGHHSAHLLRYRYRLFGSSARLDSEQGGLQGRRANTPPLHRAPHADACVDS